MFSGALEIHLTLPPLSCQQVNSVCPFDSSQLPHCVALANENNLTIGTIDDIQKLHIQVRERRHIWLLQSWLCWGHTTHFRQEMPNLLTSYMSDVCSTVIHKDMPWDRRKYLQRLSLLSFDAKT